MIEHCEKDKSMTVEEPEHFEIDDDVSNDREGYPDLHAERTFIMLTDPTQQISLIPALLNGDLSHVKTKKY